MDAELACEFRVCVQSRQRQCVRLNGSPGSEVPIDTAASVRVARRDAGRAVGQTCCSRRAARPSTTMTPSVSDSELEGGKTNTEQQPMKPSRPV